MSTKHTDQSRASEPHVYTDHELDQLHRVRTKERLFKRLLTPEQRREAYDIALSLQEQCAEAKQRGKDEAEWVEEVLPVIDGETSLAQGEEVKLRKDIANAEAKVHDAHRREHVLASATGYRWVKVDVADYADDIDFKIISVRMDTREGINRRSMTQAEQDASEARRQINLYEH